MGQFVRREMLKRFEAQSQTFLASLSIERHSQRALETYLGLVAERLHDSPSSTLHAVVEQAARINVINRSNSFNKVAVDTLFARQMRWKLEALLAYELTRVLTDTGLAPCTSVWTNIEYKETRAGLCPIVTVQTRVAWGVDPSGGAVGFKPSSLHIEHITE